MTEPGVALGSRLRRHREQRGVSLRSVAETTKISHPLLQALERGDVSQWPQGIYRSGFIRAYAAAVGLPVDETALEFARVFDPEPSPEPDPAPSAAPRSSLRLMLAPSNRGTSPSRRATVAALDVCLIMAAGLLISMPAGFTPWIAIACCALVYYAGSTIWQGRTPVAAWLQDAGAGSAPRETPRSDNAHTQPMELAMTFAADEARNEVQAPRERRSGAERRRRSVRFDPPRHRDGEGPLIATPGRPLVH